MKPLLTVISVLTAFIGIAAQVNTLPGTNELHPCCLCPDPDVVLTEFSDSIPEKEDTTVYGYVEEPPMFPGGDSAWRMFVQKTMRYPNPEVEGTVYVRFIVEKDGSVTHVEVLKHPNSQAMALEARTIVMNSPDWIPGKQGGNVVRTYVIQPIRFTLH